VRREKGNMSVKRNGRRMDNLVMVDGGATTDATGNRRALRNVRRVRSEVDALGPDNVVVSELRGEMSMFLRDMEGELREIERRDVMYIEGLEEDILSEGKLEEDGGRVKRSKNRLKMNGWEFDLFRKTQYPELIYLKIE